MKFKALVLLLLALVTSGPVAAACTQSFNLGVMGPSALRIFGNDFSSPQSFEDCYNFTLSAPADASGRVLEWDLSLLRNIDIDTVSLTGGGLSSALIDTSPSRFSFSNLAAGVYQFVVIGSVTGRRGYEWFDSVGYAGSLTTAYATTAPVPEPETYAMLALGLLAVGWTVRRRNQG